MASSNIPSWYPKPQEKEHKVAAHESTSDFFNWYYERVYLLSAGVAIFQARPTIEIQTELGACLMAVSANVTRPRFKNQIHLLLENSHCNCHAESTLKNRTCMLLCK